MQPPSLHRPDKKKKKNERKTGSIQICQIAYMGSLALFFLQFLYKSDTIPSSTFEFIFQQNVAPLPTPTREEKKNTVLTRV